MWASGNLLPFAPQIIHSETISSTMFYGIFPSFFFCFKNLLPKLHKNQFKICITSCLKFQLRYLLKILLL